MKKTTILSCASSALLVMVITVMAFDASAHSGHDHHHWASSLYHVLGSFSIVVGLSALLYYFFKAGQMKRNKLRGDQ